MKRLEDEDISREQKAKLTGEKFISLFEKCPDCKWSVWTEYSADKILNHVRDKVFPFLRELGGDDSLYSKYMKNSSFSIPTPSLLIEAVKIINDMHIKEQNRDAQGDIYEFLLGELKTAGKNGQFRTPRHIIKMMVELLDPQYGDKISPLRYLVWTNMLFCCFDAVSASKTILCPSRTNFSLFPN